MKSIQILFAAFFCVALSGYKVAVDVPNPGGVDIYCIPYGQSAGELYVRFDANSLPNYPVNLENLVGAEVTSIYKDAFGYPGYILRDMDRLVWLNAIYDVDLLATAGGGYSFFHRA